MRITAKMQNCIFQIINRLRLLKIKLSYFMILCYDKSIRAIFLGGIMSTHIVSATEASRTFSIILNKVHYQGEIYEIKRGKEVIAKISPAESPKKSKMNLNELKVFLSRVPHLEKNDQFAFEKDVLLIRNQMKPEDSSWD